MNHSAETLSRRELLCLALASPLAGAFLTSTASGQSGPVTRLNKQAVENADEILSVPGIDAFFIGPNDLHNSYGKPPAFESDAPEFNRAIEHLIAMGKKHRVPSGIHVIDAAAAQRRMAQGFQFIAVSSEAGLMLSKAGEVTKTLGLGSGKASVRY